MQVSSFNSLNEIFFLQCEKYQKEDHLFFNNLNLKKFQTYTWLDTSKNVLKLAKFLNEKNITKGDRVLLVSENRPEWLIADLAILLNSAITVPNYTTYTVNDFAFTINDCKPSGLIVSSPQLLKNILLAAKKINYNFNFIIFLNQTNEVVADNIINFSNVIEKKIDIEETKIFFKKIK
jgi:long-chain acyl-CoA synthetase